MPFLGQDWRSPGNTWTKTGCSKWEIRERDIDVVLDTIPKGHVKKIIEAFLRQVQQKKNQSLYNNLTSAPVSKCSVKEEMQWLQVGLKGSKEVHGYSTLGEMVRRLDLARAAEISYRFPYILEITDLLVRKKMNTLSATAQGHLFQLIQALLVQVLETKREIRRMQHLLNRLMTILQHQSKKTLFSSKVYWFNRIADVRNWQKDLKLIAIPRRVDNRATLSDLPVEVQRQIVLCLNDYDDIKSVSRVNQTLRHITEESSTWRVLCLKNYTNEQVFHAKLMLSRKTARQAKERIKFGRSMPVQLKRDYMNPSSTQDWKNMHVWLKKTYEKREFEYIDPLLFCKRCSVLFWQATGHPCVAQINNIDVEIVSLSPRQVVSFFEYS